MTTAVFQVLLNFKKFYCGKKTQHEIYSQQIFNCTIQYVIPTFAYGQIRSITYLPYSSNFWLSALGTSVLLD